MPRSRSVQKFLGMVLVLLAAWGALAAWQYEEFRHDRSLARETLEMQAESVASALVGGVRSHRRMGFAMETQFQGALDELAAAEDVLAVALLSEDGRLRLTSGDAALLDLRTDPPPQPAWLPGALRSVTRFELPPGGGPPPGGGRGWGRGRRGADAAEGPLAEGGTFFAVLALDTARVDALVRGAAAHHCLIAAAGGAVLACVALAWRATYRLAEARGRERLLEAEARHLRDLSQAAAGLAHETRNPLGLIRGWAQRLAKSELPTPEQHEQAEAVVEECDRVTSRINQFIAFARPREPQPQRVAPAAVIDELQVLLEPDLDQRRQRIDRSGVPPEVAIEADCELFRQAVFNLLRNALQFAPDGTSVELRIVPATGGSLRLEVADRGPGVPAGEVPRLFTPYHTTRSDGTGLGLAIVRHIALGHGWSAGYSPREGGGAVFWIEGLTPCP